MKYKISFKIVMDRLENLFYRIFGRSPLGIGINNYANHHGDRLLSGSSSFVNINKSHGVATFKFVAKQISSYNTSHVTPYASMSSIISRFKGGREDLGVVEIPCLAGLSFVFESELV